MGGCWRSVANKLANEDCVGVFLFSNIGDPGDLFLGTFLCTKGGVQDALKGIALMKSLTQLCG